MNNIRAFEEYGGDYNYNYKVKSKNKSNVVPYTISGSSGTGFYGTSGIGSGAAGGSSGADGIDVSGTDINPTRNNTMRISYEYDFYDILNSMKNNHIAKKIINTYRVDNKEYWKMNVNMTPDYMLELKYTPTDEYVKTRREHNASSMIKTEIMKIGSFLTKYINKDYSKSEVEDFVHSLRAAYDNYMSMDDFMIVKGEDIVKWYSKKNSKITSCMTDRPFKTRFYAMNPNKVRMLVLLDESKKKSIGRCLLWKLDYPEGKIYADKIYYNKLSDEKRFRRYIEQKGWLSSHKGSRYDSKLVILDTFLGILPYLDTFDVVSRIPTILKTGNPPTSYIKAVIKSTFSFNKKFEKLNNFQDYPNV